MGQRLVINIKHRKDIKCNAYYHWSGFTAEAMSIIKQMRLDKFEEKYGHMTPIIAGINLLISTGANFGKDRNEGLIEVDKEGIKNNLRWSEMTINIDLESKTVDFNDCFRVIKPNQDKQWLCGTVDCLTIPFEEANEFAGMVEDRICNIAKDTKPIFYLKLINTYVEPSVW